MSHQFRLDALEGVLCPYTYSFLPRTWRWWRETSRIYNQTCSYLTLLSSHRIPDSPFRAGRQKFGGFAHAGFAVSFLWGVRLLLLLLMMSWGWRGRRACAGTGIFIRHTEPKGTNVKHLESNKTSLTNRLFQHKMKLKCTILNVPDESGCLTSGVRLHS